MKTAIAIDLLLALLNRAQAIGALLSKAKAEGRDVTDAELDQLVADDDAAKAAGRAAREKARRNG